MKDAYILGGIRSPFGRHAGALAPIRTDDLAASTLRQMLERFPVDQATIDDVFVGCTNQAGEDSRNVARNAALLAGLPVSVPGMTLNRLCASGLAAVIQAGQTISANHGDLFIAGGVEGMSRAPFVVAKADSPYSRTFQSFDSTMGERFPNPEIHRQFGAHSMPQTGDNVAKEFGVSREQADEFALASQHKYGKAAQAGFFDDEIVPITIKPSRPKDEPVLVSKDEHPRPDTNMAALAKLKPLFADGVVTAGNASGINDGAAFLIVGSNDAAKKNNLRPIARIISSAASGVEPRIMGVGPVAAIQKALNRANLTLRDMDLIEINEAFASQVLACTNLLGIKGSDQRLNPNGGAIAVGHPLGASGARLTLTAARQLQKSQGRYAVVSLCIGLGQGLAMVIERT